MERKMEMGRKIRLKREKKMERKMEMGRKIRL
jgi:hypothetical protein